MKRFLLTIILISFVTSCQQQTEAERLEETPLVNYEQAFQEVQKLYRMGAPAFYGEADITSGPVAAIGGYLSGYFDNESKGDARFVEPCQVLNLDNTYIQQMTEEVWSSAYQAIEFSNVIIDNLTDLKSIDEGQRDALIAEAKFFRVFNYFYLVKLFGEIPLVKGLEKAEDANLSTLSNLYSFMASELEDIAGDLSEESGRISPFVAKALLCDIYLTASGYPLKGTYYTDAARVARDIISSSPYSLTQSDSTMGVSAYRSLYNAGSKELIYSYRPESSNYASLSFSKSASEWGVLPYSTNNAYRPMADFIKLYDSKLDVRAKDGELFHSFYRYTKGDRTIIQSFEHSPYIWFEGSGVHQSKKLISIYRFAEVLLIAAEAIASSEGVTAEAVEYLTMVRSRAYPSVSREAISMELSTLDTQSFIEEVWSERVRELALEMKIWSDIQRTRRYPIPSSERFIEFVDIVGSQNPFGGTFNLQSLFIPIP